MAKLNDFDERNKFLLQIQTKYLNDGILCVYVSEINSYYKLGNIIGYFTRFGYSDGTIEIEYKSPENVFLGRITISINDFEIDDNCIFINSMINNGNQKIYEYQIKLPIVELRIKTLRKILFGN